MEMMIEPPLGLRQRRQAAEEVENDAPVNPQDLAEETRPAPPPQRRTTSPWKVSHLYCAISIILAIMAVVLAPNPHVVPIEEEQEDDEEAPDDPRYLLQSLLRLFHVKRDTTDHTEHPQIAPPVPQHWIDPAILSPMPHTPALLMDKVLTSTPRLLAIANLLLAVTYIIHTVVAAWFLSPAHTRPTRDRMGGFLVFKMLLISAVVGPDTLDLLILLAWFTLLSCLRSLDHLAHATTQHLSALGQAPRRGVLQLLFLVLTCDIVAAAFCVGLFHHAGWGMVLLLTCDCALLGADVLEHILKHVQSVWEDHHSREIQDLESQQLRLHTTPENQALPYAPVHQESRRLDRQMEVLDLGHSRRVAILGTTTFALEVICHLLTVAHFLHIWSLHGVQFNLIDGVLALHLHSALSSACRKVAQRRNLNTIARDLQDLFPNASDEELRKASAAGDVCCICLGTMTTCGHVKKVRCGHLYHTHCLREVVERAQSIQAAKCPLCRASVLNGRRTGDTTRRCRRCASRTRRCSVSVFDGWYLPCLVTGSISIV